MTAITSKQLADRRAEGERIELLDVRTPVEFSEVHVDFARNVPLDQLRPESVTGGRDGGGVLKERYDEVQRDRPIAVICGTGYRGSIAASFLKSNGYDDVSNVLGGMTAWKAAGLPTTK
jgi:hydroxyacylglutathione hydrolase